MPPRRCNAVGNNAANPAENNVANNNGDFTQNFIAAVQTLIHHEVQGEHNQAPGAPEPPGPANNVNRVIEQFRRLIPPRFNGRDGPLVLEEWTRELERIFAHMECTDPQKVSCAIFQLSDEAGHWWELHWRVVSGRYPNLTWAQFKEEISEKYFPESYKEQK